MLLLNWILLLLCLYSVHGTWACVSLLRLVATIFSAVQAWPSTSAHSRLGENKLAVHEYMSNRNKNKLIDQIGWMAGYNMVIDTYYHE